MPYWVSACASAFQVRLRAELRVDGAMVRHIVAMETTLPRPEEGGGIEVSDA